MNRSAIEQGIPPRHEVFDLPYGKGDEAKSPEQHTFLERLLEQSHTVDAQMQLFADQLRHALSDMLASKDMLPHLRSAAEQLQEEIEALLASEQIDFDAIVNMIDMLREQTYERSLFAEKEAVAEARKQEVRDTVRIALEERPELSESMRQRILASAEHVMQDRDVSPPVSLRFVGYGATKDVFCIEDTSARAIAMVHADAGHTINDVIREVEISQKIDIPGVITYTNYTLYNRKGEVTSDSKEAVQAQIESEFVRGLDTLSMMKLLYHELHEESIQEATKKQMLDGYIKQINQLYDAEYAAHEQQYGVVLEEYVFRTLIERYAEQFESIFERPAQEIIQRLERYLHITAEKQSALSQTERQTPDVIGKEILVRAIAAKQLSKDVQQRADRLRITSFERVASSLKITAEAIDALHAKGYVHQDIKPDNIIGLQLDTSESNPTVIDLGITTTIEDIHSLQKGTKRYMEPEVFGPGIRAIIEQGGVTTRKDVRAFTITLFDAMSEAFGMDRLTVFPPVMDSHTGLARSGESVVSELSPIIRYYEGDMKDKYAFLQLFLQHHLDLPKELLTIFDPHPALDNTQTWTTTCTDVHEAFQHWIGSRTGKDLEKIRAAFSYLANPEIFMRAYTTYKNKQT
jgi:serine/threonine protein kinase